MLIRIFANSNTEDKAIQIYKKFIQATMLFIKDEKIDKVEPYWKYDDMYVIEANIILICDMESKRFGDFLNKISDKWQFFGTPVDEVLASLNIDGCKYMIDGIEMINIFK